MLKRTKGRLLLTLLVITGLAGTLKDNAISGKERKEAVNLLKETRAEVIKSVKGLSNAQLDFRAAPDRWSVRECIYHIAITEKNLQDALQRAMRAPANPDKRADIKATDDGLVKMMKDRSNKVKTSESLEPQNTKYTSVEDALTQFKMQRAELIKYVKTTTEDLRNHVVEFPFGSFDSYQLILFMAGHSNRHYQQINEVKADPNFPRQ